MVGRAKPGLKPVSPATTRVADNEPQYDGLASLRQALTADDPDQRAPAYGAVMEADLEPSEVLSTEPPEGQLRQAGVIPEKGGRDQTTDAQMARVIELLEQIEANTGGAQ